MALNAVRVYDPARSAAHERAELPVNITVTSLYRPLVASMLQRSATFRHQCARIGRAPYLTIEIRSEVSGRRGAAAAWTNIVRQSGARLHAVVTVPFGDRRAELIAHELEHVLEQLDGVNLSSLSQVESSGVRECNCEKNETYETTRAIKAGLRVAEEVGESNR